MKYIITENQLRQFIRRFNTEKERSSMMQEIDDWSLDLDLCEYETFDDYWDDVVKNSITTYLRYSNYDLFFKENREDYIKIFFLLENYMKKEWSDVALKYYNENIIQCDE